MPAYVVSRVLIKDEIGMQKYVNEVVPTVELYGGRYLYRGAQIEALEGDWEHDRMVVLEFDDRQAAKNWYDSAEYRPHRDLRWQSAEAIILLVG